MRVHHYGVWGDSSDVERARATLRLKFSTDGGGGCYDARNPCQTYPNTLVSGRSPILNTEQLFEALDD